VYCKFAFEFHNFLPPLAHIRASTIKHGVDGSPNELLAFGKFWRYRNGAWIPLQN
jgi:hypothetical protein